MTVNDVAVSFGVHRITAQRFMTTSVVKEMPKRLTPREERYIRITAGRDLFLPAARIVNSVRRATGVPIIRATSPQ
jgi:hypothetical protein